MKKKGQEVGKAITMVTGKESDRTNEQAERSSRDLRTAGMDAIREGRAWRRVQGIVMVLSRCGKKRGARGAKRKRSWACLSVDRISGSKALAQ